MSTGWVFVDVETTGLNPSWDRVVSVSAVAFDGGGRLAGELHTLVDPQRDPGPVHIHGLTKERLAGSPVFDAIAPEVVALTHGRVLVAHNAQFDYKFLHAEAERSSAALPTTHRLCTVALSRRLDLPVSNHKLATVAAYWGVPQVAAHDARDDVRVLREVFLRSEDLARRLGIELPVMACAGRGAPVYPASIPRVPSPYANPGRWTPPARLIQGMKIVITGTTTRPRQALARQLSELGFDVMNSVSSQTRLLVCNEPAHVSVKHEKALALGIPVVTEVELVALLTDVAPGVLRGSKPSPQEPRPKKTTTATPAGPWSGRSVLVLGGAPSEAAEARERAGQLGARVLLTLGARTTHVVYLDGAEQDKRHTKILERGLVRLSAADLLDSAAAPSQPPSCAGDPSDTDGSVEMSRGHVIDLPEDSQRLSLSASWQAPALTTGSAWEVDVVAFALGADGQVRSDDDFVFYNEPSTEDGGLRLSVDGSCEQGLEIDLESLPDHTAVVRVAAAIDGEATFGDVGAIRLALADDDNEREVAAATLDAATDERTLVLAELYRRGDVWRFRAVGQGHLHGLAQLATGHGVDIG